MKTTILYNNVYSFNLTPEYGVLETRIPKPIIRIIDEEIKLARDRKISRNHDLAGYIKEEYTIPSLAASNEFRELLSLLSIKHSEVYPDYYGRMCSLSGIKGHKILLTDPWVNVMRKHEFNPVHNHGGMFSYVIWAQIPFSYEDEVALHPQSTAQDQIASFNFLYPHIAGGVKCTSMQPEQGNPWNMVLFPSRLDHFVSPFYTSDGERISVSGNIYLVEGDLETKHTMVGDLTPEEGILP